MRRRSRWALLVLVAVLAVFGLLQTPLLGMVRGRVWSWWVASVGRLGGYEGLDKDRASRESSLLAENIRLKAEQQDYERLRQQLGTASFAGFRSVPVVLGRPLDTFRSQFLLSKGTQDGLTLGAPLVVQGSVLIGFITDLREQTAVAQLLLAPGTTLAVQVEPAGATGLVRGHYYTSLLLTTVPRDIVLKEQQAVVTEAKPNVLPFGLVIGTIARIQSSDNAVYQEARLALPYEVDQLRAANILLPR